MKTTFTTATGSIWNTEKPIRSSLSSVNGGKLTGKWEQHDINGDIECMVEVDHGFGKDMVFEQFISQ